MTSSPAVDSHVLTRLAGTARESLTVCNGGTLHVEGLDCTRALSTEALVHDDDGCPTFVCAPDSPLVTAARNARAAVFSVLPTAPRHAPIGEAPLELVEVVLAGRLELDDGQPADGVVTVRLRVASVIAECEQPQGIADIAVPLAHYRAAGGRAVEAAAARIVEHTNRAHAAELRAAAARASGTPVEQIAGASVAAVDADGMTLHWVTASGAHSVRRDFPRHADGPRALATQLREALAAGRSC